MKKELAKSEKIVLMRNGIRIYLDNEEAEVLEQALKSINKSTFLGLKGRTINSADISGIFLPEDYEQLWHDKRGDWQCPKCGVWLNKNERECSACKMRAYQSNTPKEVLENFRKNMK